jgi:hypothetical protein
MALLEFRDSRRWFDDGAAAVAVEVMSMSVHKTAVGWADDYAKSKPLCRQVKAARASRCNREGVCKAAGPICNYLLCYGVCIVMVSREPFFVLIFFGSMVLKIKLISRTIFRTTKNNLQNQKNVLF